MNKRDQLVAAHLDFVEGLTDWYVRRNRVDPDIAQDWRQVARISLTRTIELSGGNESPQALKRHIRRNVKSRLIELAMALRSPGNDALDRPAEPLPSADGGLAFDGYHGARSLSPPPYWLKYIENIGEVQMLLLETCAVDGYPRTLGVQVGSLVIPGGARKRRYQPGDLSQPLPELCPANKHRLLEHARRLITEERLSRISGLPPGEAEPLLLMAGLELTESEAARVLGRSLPAVSKSLKKVRIKFELKENRAEG